MDDFDSLLASVGINMKEEKKVSFTVSKPKHDHLVTPEVVEVCASPAVEENPPAEEEQVQITPLTDEDFNDILEDNGFMEDEDYDEEEEDNEDAEDGTLSAEDITTLHETAIQSTVPNETQESSTVDPDREDDEYFDHLIETGVLREVHLDEYSVSQQAVHLAEELQRQFGQQVQEEAQQDENNPNIIAQNSESLLVDESSSRFSGTEWYNKIQEQRIILAGLGGIGSNVAFQIARMHPERLVMYDDDIVDASNMSGQLYSSRDVGTSKVSAIRAMIGNYASTANTVGFDSRFTSESPGGPVMICGFDNMEARKTFFNVWKDYLNSIPEENRKKCLYIDGRLSIDTLQVLCIRGDDNYNINRYKDRFLFNDSQADETICSLKQTTYLACMIASVMVNLFTNFTANLLDPVIPYDLPFFTEYDAQNMIFKTEQ